MTAQSVLRGQDRLRKFRSKFPNAWESAEPSPVHSPRGPSHRGEGQMPWIACLHPFRSWVSGKCFRFSPVQLEPIHDLRPLPLVSRDASPVRTRPGTQQTAASSDVLLGPGDGGGRGHPTQAESSPLDSQLSRTCSSYECRRALGPPPVVGPFPCVVPPAAVERTGSSQRGSTVVLVAVDRRPSRPELPRRRLEAPPQLHLRSCRSKRSWGRSRKTDMSP